MDYISEEVGGEITWHPDEEATFAAALLYAGAEPNTETNPDRWTEWQLKVAEILMQKYQDYWWYDIDEMLWDENVSAREHSRACDIKRDVRRNELRKFYTWVCKQRGEPWTDRIASPVLAFM